MSSEENSTGRQVEDGTDQNTTGKDDEHLVKTQRDYFGYCGKSNMIEHKIEHTDNNPVRSRPNPLLHAMRENLKKEIEGMLRIKII